MKVEMVDVGAISCDVRLHYIPYRGLDQEGVMLLSGFSPSLMKFFLSGEMEEERITLDEGGVKTRTL